MCNRNWADANCRENIASNGVADRIEPMLGDVRRIAGRHYGFILANINRNRTSTVPTTVPKTTVPKAVKDLVDKGEIKVDNDGNITDTKGKKVEVKDGKVSCV